jgi:methyltransferase family protein
MNTPYRWIPFFSSGYRAIRRWVLAKYFAGDNVFCSVCSRSFKSWLDRRENGVCPYCLSEARHRILCRYLETYHLPESTPVKLLYFAPTWGQEKFFRQQAHLYNCVTTDLAAPNVDVQSDITDLVFDSESFDFLVCCHVLEHIPQDTKAIHEIHRVLRSGGTAFIQVPYAREAKFTDEDPSVVDPKERARRFLQFDHVRLYGQDLVDRLRIPGFHVEVVNISLNNTSDENMRLGFWDDLIFVCKKNEK